LTQREQARLQVLNQVVGHEMTTPEAAQILGLSERHTWRMLATYREEGAAALAHGNRGRRPANAISQETRQQVIPLASTRYSGFNYTHLTELLAEREGLFLTRSRYGTSWRKPACPAQIGIYPIPTSRHNRVVNCPPEPSVATKGVLVSALSSD